MLDFSELTCTKCETMFNKADKMPRLLPECGHTLCTGCISALMKTLQNGSFVCPEDGYFFVWGNKTVESPAGPGRGGPRTSPET